MPRVIIVHGWDGYPEEGWFPWLKQELEKKGFEVQVPAFPETKTPKLDKWLPYLQSIAGRPDENLFLVGHSVGCITILRYLESLKESEKIGGAILVAGWFYLENLETDEEKHIAKPWLQTPIDFNKVKEHTKNFVAILSDNDPFGALEENKKTFSEKLGARVIVEKQKGHFSGSDGVTELPIVLESIIKLTHHGK